MHSEISTDAANELNFLAKFPLLEHPTQMALNVCIYIGITFTSSTQYTEKKMCDKNEPVVYGDRVT